MSLEPHHIFGVKSPAWFFKCPSGQVLCPCSFHIIENVEECIVWQFCEELRRVHITQTCLRIIARTVWSRLTVHVITRLLRIRQLRKMFECGFDGETHLIVFLFNLKRKKKYLFHSIFFYKEQKVLYFTCLDMIGVGPTNSPRPMSTVSLILIS